MKFNHRGQRITAPKTLCELCVTLRVLCGKTIGLNHREHEVDTENAKNSRTEKPPRTLCPPQYDLWLKQISTYKVHLSAVVLNSV